MDKDLVACNIDRMVHEGVFLDKYIELTGSFDVDFNNPDSVSYAEKVAAGIFNAILIGCQLFDDDDRIIKFVDMYSQYLDNYVFEYELSNFDITNEEARNRLMHGFGVHFTTTNICDEIFKSGKMAGFGKNAMFTKEEDEIIKLAEREQRSNNPDAEKDLTYLFRGWGTGVSSYGSLTNGYWMYHTPESLSFLFGNISMRDKNRAMEHVMTATTHVSEDKRKEVVNVMSNIYDRLIGDSEEVACILIDRDSFKYEVDYYYNMGTQPVAVERRPYSRDFNSLNNSDSPIQDDLSASELRFVTVPTIKQLEKMKREKLEVGDVEQSHSFDI